MTHAGRVHRISGKAEEISGRILGAIPKDKLVYGRGLRRPLWSKIEFQDTAEERRYLREAAKKYNAQNSPDEMLIAHGTQDAATLCQILLDGELRHVIGIENYGNLAYEESIQTGGYWDRGWGLFIATPRIVQHCKTDQYRVVPIQELKGVLLPNPLVEIVRTAFPEQENKIMSYQTFAQEIERRI